MYNVHVALVLLVVLFALTGCALALATRTPSSTSGDNERSATVPVPLIRLWWPDVDPPVPLPEGSAPRVRQHLLD